MLILHAGLLDGRFLLWGETSPLADTATPAKAGRKAKPKAGSPLPFAAGPWQLSDALHTLLPDAGPFLPAEPVLAWLPSVRGVPVASSPVIAEPPWDASDAKLLCWAVTPMALPHKVVVELLSLCLDQTMLAPGVGVGSTLAFFASAMQFAGGLVRREQFLPDLHSVGDRWRARWVPYLTGTDATRFDKLARAMPPAARALSENGIAPPSTPAAELLTEFLTLAVDDLVRKSPATSRPTAFDSVHDEWLYALRSPTGFVGAGKEWPNLAKQVRQWHRPAAVVAGSPFRLCFRLEEPGDDTSTDWRVSYLLQRRDDPSLLIPAADAWNPKGRVADVFRSAGFAGREYLLTALGQASGLCPPVAASLKSAAPGAFATDTNGAHRFLTETAWLLEQAGFGVMLPSWWTATARPQLTAAAHVKSPPMSGGSGMSLAELIKFDWRIAVGDQEFTLKELEALATLKSPLVRVRGRWVQVDATEIRAAIELLKKRGPKMTLRDLMRLDLGSAELPGGLRPGRVAGTGWVADFLKELHADGSFHELPTPAGVRATLRPYQRRGFSWLAFLRKWGLGACLADDMGLGKTLQTLTLLERDRESGAAAPSLLVCPMSVVGNWKKEAERFTPDLPVLVHHGAKRAKGAAFAKEARKHSLVISSYGLLVRDQELFGKVKWSGVILDEAQNIKNPLTKQAEAARELAGEYRIALTGTPVENHVGDLWSIWEFLDRGFLGTQAEFRRKFFVPIQMQHDPEASSRLKRLTGPFLLRRLKSDPTVIADLPDKIESKVYCTLTKEQATLYAAVVDDLSEAVASSEGMSRRGLILGSLSKLKQVCNHPAQFLGDHSAIPERSGKLARLAEMLDEVLQSGEKSLIFTQFTEMGELLKKHLTDTFGREVLFLHGGTPRTQRDHMVTRFQTDENAPPIFLLSLKAGGTGLNLTAAAHVFHFDRWWNPAVENQATDRAYRIGQSRNVQVHKFVCVGTLEEKIDEMIERKQAVAEKVVGTGEGWLTELSNDQLRDLVTLRADALGD